MHADSTRTTRPTGLPAVCRTPVHRYIGRLPLVLATLGLLILGQASAQDAAGLDSAQAALAPPATAAAKPDKNGKICQYEDVTGSRMKRRVCLTPEAWEARQKAAKDFARELDAKPVSKDADGD